VVSVVARDPRGHEFDVCGKLVDCARTVPAHSNSPVGATFNAAISKCFSHNANVTNFFILVKNSGSLLRILKLENL